VYCGVEKILWVGSSGFQSFVSSFFLPSVALAGKYSFWSAKGFPARMELAASGQTGGSQCAGGQLAQWAGSGGVVVAAHLFFQCIVALRILPRARVLGCQIFSSLLYFTSANCVSNISARSLVHRVHAVCICVPVTILDPLSVVTP
jgi:hypothetical protein